MTVHVVTLGTPLSESSASTSHSVPLPTVAAGAFLGIALSMQSATASFNTPSGWTQLYQRINSNVVQAFFYKQSNGGEGTSVTVTTTASLKVAGCSIMDTGWDGVAPAVSTVADGSSTSPNPGSVTATGALDNLFIAIAHAIGTTGFTGYPTSYTNTQTGQTTGGTSAGTATATRTLASASDDPSTFTMGTGQWSAYTIVLGPSGELYPQLERCTRGVNRGVY